MIVTELFHDLPLTTHAVCRVSGDAGQTVQQTDEVLVEHLMDVYVNETLTMKLVCIPQHLVELVLGRLLTEGIIRSTADVEKIYVCEYGSRARVMLKEVRQHEERAFVETTPSCCTGNHILNDAFVQGGDMAPVTPIPWKREWISALSSAFRNGMLIHERTHATHSAFLAMEGRILFACEDIGRHNALDKAIGYALRNSIDLKKCMLFTSGRVPTDMVLKAIRAGVPILITQKTVTDAAISLAELYHLTLVCASSHSILTTYTSPGTPSST